jgi:hypothetical protein
MGQENSILNRYEFVQYIKCELILLIKCVFIYFVINLITCGLINQNIRHNFMFLNEVTSV